MKLEPPPPSFRWTSRQVDSDFNTSTKRVPWYDYSAPAIAWGGISCFGWIVLSKLTGRVISIGEGFVIWALVFFIYSGWMILKKIWQGK